MHLKICHIYISNVYVQLSVHFVGHIMPRQYCMLKRFTKSRLEYAMISSTKVSIGRA